MNFSWAMELDPKGINNQIKEAIDKRYATDEDESQIDDSGRFKILMFMDALFLVSSVHIDQSTLVYLGKLTLNVYLLVIFKEFFIFHMLVCTCIQWGINRYFSVTIFDIELHNVILISLAYPILLDRMIKNSPFQFY